ncbi:MAG: hypothetical protein MUO38_00780, partial [Anaerolineales bacterium]|nr:hypothetical protein [Anaerolineales bacterium]
MELRILNAQEVRPALPMAAAMAAVKQALAQLSRSPADVPLLTRLGLAGRKAVTLFMPAYLQKTGDMAFKIVSAFPQNLSRGLPASHTLVVALDAQTGGPLPLLEGAPTTAMRTGAASGAPTDGLARLEPSIAAVFGN